MEQTKKPAGKRSRGMPLGARAALVAAVVLAALFGIYALLCVWAGGSDRILPGVVCMTPEGEEIDLGGMTVEEADQALQASYGQAIEHCSLTVTAGEGVSHQLEGNLLTADTEAAARQALELTNQVPFLQRGISRIWGAGRQEVPHAGLTLSQEGETALDTLLDQLESELNTPAVESQYTLGEDSVEVILGTPGSALDRESAKIQILQALPRSRFSRPSPAELPPWTSRAPRWSPRPSPPRPLKRTSMWMPSPCPWGRTALSPLLWWASP